MKVDHSRGDADLEPGVYFLVPELLAHQPDFLLLSESSLLPSMVMTTFATDGGVNPQPLAQRSSEHTKRLTGN